MGNKLFDKLNDFVVSGDWVCIRQIDGDNYMIEDLLERKNKFVRRKAGTINDEQIIGVNLDRIFVVTAVDDDFNPRRLERYITQARHDRIPVTIVLSKADLTDRIDFYKDIARKIHPGGDVIAISSYRGAEGLQELSPFLRKGETIALVGSSGVGKSTIVNTLFGDEIQRVKEVNPKTGKGGHTTTSKQLRAFEKGFILLDTPGMREFGVLNSSGEAVKGFEDIEEWAVYCHFNNCRHDTEEGCAVKAAVADGHLAQKRLDNFQKITYEQDFLWVKGRRISKDKLRYGKKKKRRS
jgi:ribosome biogenesis GTPase